MEDVAAVQEAIKAAIEGFEGQDLSTFLLSTLSESTKDLFQKFSSKIIQAMSSCIAEHDTVRIVLARETALTRQGCI